MSIKRLIPSPFDVGREAVIVIGGALIAAAVIGYLPGVREWIKRQWSGGSDRPQDTPWL